MIDPFSIEAEVAGERYEKRLVNYLPDVFGNWTYKYYSAFIAHTLNDALEVKRKKLDKQTLVLRTQARLVHKGPITLEQASTILALIGK